MDIYYNASIDSSYATADEEMFWEMPRFELRNFMITGLWVFRKN